MKRQLLRGTMMSLLVVALTLISAAASAAQSRMATADVPFDFVAANKTLPAGHYNISASTAGSEVLKISASQKSATVFAMTIPLSRNKATDKGKLVFRRYGNRYFLAEIWAGGEREGQKLQKSREEKAIENELAIISSKSELAQNRFERVEIALVKN